MAISKLIIFIGIAIILGGCGILEKIWLVPEVETEVLFNPILGNKEVLNAITVAVSDVAEKTVRGWYDKDVAYVNVLEGVLETGSYSKSNITGMGLRAEIDRNDQLIRLNLKGADIYYTALPLQDGLREIQTAVVCRLKEAVQLVKKKPITTLILSILDLKPPSSVPNTFISCAFACEAKPLIDHYKLKKDTTVQAFSVFCNDDITLTVTGIGKTAMAAGVAYTLAVYPLAHNQVMLNIGIAGHKHHDIGSLFLADKITDNGTGRSYYPPLVFTPPCPTANLITFAKPQDTYPPATALCDMEASGFYETATRFTSGELCQCLKIVSDNESTPATGIQPNRVSELIHNHLDTIGAIVATLGKLADSFVTPDLVEFQRLTSQYRFTANEQIQLKKLLSRWHLVKGDDPLDFALSTAKTGKEFLLQLATELNEANFYL